MGRIRNAWRRVTSYFTSVPTNYGARTLPAGYMFTDGTTLAVDTYVTFLRKTDGSLVVQTPLAYFGKII